MPKQFLIAVVVTIAGFLLIATNPISSSATVVNSTQAATSQKQAIQPRPPLTTNPNKHAVPVTLSASCPQQIPSANVFSLPVPAPPSVKLYSVAVFGWNSEFYQLFGGYLSSDTTQGIIVVNHLSLDPCKDKKSVLSSALLLTQSKHGGVHFTSIRSNLVDFAMADGTVGLFDIITNSLSSK